MNGCQFTRTSQPVSQTHAEMNHFSWLFWIAVVLQWLCSQPHLRYWLSTRKKKHRIPQAAMMIPGTMKDIPQADETKRPAMREPRMFPTEVCEFHTPMMKPRLLIGMNKQTKKHTEAVRTPGVMHHSEKKCFHTSSEGMCVKSYWILFRGPDTCQLYQFEK